MYFISSRVNLDNEDRIAAKDTYWNVTVKRGMATKRKRISRSEFSAAMRKKYVLLLVHGYNNEFEDVVRSYDIIRRNTKVHLARYYDEVVGYTWPGGDDPLDWYGAKRRAGSVGARFGHLLNSLSSRATVVDVMSHSLGARVVFKGLQVSSRNAVRANFMMASAVDNESVERGEKYYRPMRRASESVIFYTKHDYVLRYGYRAAEWDRALGHSGPENPGAIVAHSPTVTVANCKRVVHSHGAYKTSVAVYRFLNDWLRGRVSEQFVTL